MTTNNPIERARIVPGLELEIEDAIDTPAMVGKIATDNLDPDIAVTIHCTEALVHYVEELHAPHGFDQFLTAAECAQVAALIDSTGENLARTNEYFAHRSALGSLQGNPSVGWNVENLREADKIARQRTGDLRLPEYARESLTLLRALVDYLDAFHGTGGFREVLTADERRLVGELVSSLLNQQPNARR